MHASAQSCPQNACRPWSCAWLAHRPFSQNLVHCFAPKQFIGVHGRDPFCSTCTRSFRCAYQFKYSVYDPRQPWHSNAKRAITGPGSAHAQALLQCGLSLPAALQGMSHRRYVCSWVLQRRYRAQLLLLPSPANTCSVHRALLQCNLVKDKSA